eukprot:TRINITY_DN7194_c1_g2_i1.p2 TRINITY_DN7194_c1_g2~~TRINITY_DN7194_c1_g2_i1.p2  ORF type:complete len:189 (+),score=59.07 TRINITY_DN7194_c1_g2_i1:98-664(+)
METRGGVVGGAGRLLVPHHASDAEVALTFACVVVVQVCVGWLGVQLGRVRRRAAEEEVELEVGEGEPAAAAPEVRSPLSSPAESPTSPRAASPEPCIPLDVTPRRGSPTHSRGPSSRGSMSTSQARSMRVGTVGPRQVGLQTEAMRMRQASVTRSRSIRRGASSVGSRSTSASPAPAVFDFPIALESW